MADIYALTDPRDGAIRYIGKANVATQRLKTHLRDARRRDTPVYRWIRKLLGLGMRPGLLVLERADDWKEAERRLISEARDRGDRLLNVSDGGDEPYCSAEVRSANGHKLTEKIRSDPVFRQLREAKRRLQSGLSAGLVANRTRARMRELAELHPEMFGLWASLPDRAEDENGDPVGGYGQLKGGGHGAPEQADR